MVEKRKRKKSKQLPFDHYIIQIQDWRMSYSVHLDPKERFNPGPYWERQYLEIDGVFLEPEKLRSLSVESHFKADRILPRIIAGIQETDFDPKIVGYMEARKQKYDFWASLSADFFQMLPLLLHLKKLNFIVLTGTIFYRGSADIKAFRLEYELDPEDY